jgi:dTMP kinase
VSESSSPGFLIAFEGTGGSGKSTLGRRLVQWLESRGFPVVAVREPGSTELGASLRSLLLSTSRSPVAWAETFMFQADRAQTYGDIIIPALRDGKVVVSDRSMYSTIAYQGFGRGLDIEILDDLNRIATCGVRPDLVFVLDLDPIEGLRRKRGNHGQDGEDRFDDEGLLFQQRVREGYLFAAGRDADRAYALDAALPADEIFDRVCEIVANRLAGRVVPAASPAR